MLSKTGIKCQSSPNGTFTEKLLIKTNKIKIGNAYMHIINVCFFLNFVMKELY